ncbi:MAG: methylmalonyl-CoA mutase small subunit [Tannerella sp.]|jgi:methylmalonyl-CoA mutase|nr:methylmalonyl-CoA mutase small subunit [Tannerella sp.]
MAETNEKLFSEFPPVTPQEWVDKIKVDLKDVPYEKKMIWKTGEGFNVNAFYTAEDIENLKTAQSLPGEFPYVRGTKVSNDWLVRQDIDVKDFKAANEKAKKLLVESGVTSLGFHFKGDFATKENVSVLLDGIFPEMTELNFKTCNRKAGELIGILAEIYREKGSDLSKCKGSVGYNPFKKPLVKGKAADDWVAETIQIFEASKALPKYKTIAVDACFLSDAGAYITQELGYALANGNDILAKLSEAGLPVDKIAKKIKFNFGVSSNYFMEIAKFRAARRLWAEIVNAYNPICKGGCSEEEQPCTCACKIRIHARTSEWNMTIYDAHVNLLRSQTEAMSAAIAGVDSLAVIPFDEMFKKPNDFSERIARNQQLLLKEECHFDKVIDPSAGSYYVETLTESIAQTAWKIFLEVEDRGGFGAAANAGEIQKAVNASNAERKKQIATRRLTLLGTNQYPNFREQANDEIEIPVVASDCGCGNGGTVTKLDFSRGAEDFEILRLATEKSGKRPKVFMLTIGNLAMRLARSQFSSNFFACAGYEIVDNLGFETVEAGVKAAREKQADIIVLCSSDDEYEALAPEAFKLIEGREAFVVAGAPACMDALKAAGIEYFINVKSNVLETLQMFNNKFNIN